MNTHNPSEIGRLAQEARAEITKNQTEIRLAEPKLRHLEQAIALKKAELDKMIAEAKHSQEEIQRHKDDLAHGEREFRAIQIELQKINGGGHRLAA